MDTELQDLFATAIVAGLKEEELKELSHVHKKTEPKYREKPIDYRFIGYLVGIIIVLFAVSRPSRAYKEPILYAKDLYADYFVTSDSACLLNHNIFSIETTRPITKCDICKNLDEFPVVENITKDYFLQHHAYTGIPVLIKKATGNWTALRVFGYKYFKTLYTKLDGALDKFEDLNCQFFGYKTNLKTLSHVFSMSKKRAALKKDQWYVGWSNCVASVQKILRKHYQRPEFLPDDSESSSLDWIFMGGSGNGAPMHIDMVDRPSWQAMVKGKKTWYLSPPPECETVCKKSFSATMEPGDILVVDTNRWFHSTYIHPGNLSVTIGSEYD